MAEGGDNQRRTINNDFESQEDLVTVGVHNIGHQTNVEAGEIGQVYQGTTAASHPGASGFTDGGEEKILFADSTQPLTRHLQDVNSEMGWLKLSDQHGQYEGDDVIALNEKSQIALPSNKIGNRLALPVVIPSFSLNGGTFDRANFGPQTNTKHVEANTIEHATITHVHHHYGGDDNSEESPSTSGATEARPKRNLQKGFVQITDDIFMNPEKPLKEGTKIYEGYQEHVTGQRRRLAIKAIIPCNKKSIREVQHLVKLSPHPNVVRIVRSKEHKGHLSTLYIAMELCDSKNLHDYLNENREKNIPFDFKKTMSYSKRLVKAMKHIHRNRIIHGDLKPENILFSLDGGQIKVSDFGISKELRQSRNATKMTSQGTDGYRAPETYNSDVISMMADIYSLDVILYSLWTNGRHPFGENPYQRIVNIINNTSRDLSCLPEEMGTKKYEFLDLLDKMLQVDPKNRPTIEEISRHPFLSSSLVTAQASSTRQMRLGSSPEETLPELHFLASTTPETAITIQETEPEDGREPMMQRPDIDRSPRQENSPEATHRVSASAQTQADEEKADKLINNSKYEEAISLLENLSPTKRQQTQLMECYFQLKRDLRVRKCIETMKMLMMRHPRPKADDVFKLGETNLQNSLLVSWPCIFHRFVSRPDKKLSRVQALNFFSCASKLYMLDSKPDDAVLGIENCTFHCNNAIEAMVGQGGRMRVLAIDIGIGIINEMLVDIRSITHADPDQRAKHEWYCLNNLGMSFRAIKKPDKSIAIYKQGIELIERHSASNASKYLILGDLLNNMGVANIDLSNYHEAEKMFLESLKAYELAQDCVNKEKNKTSIDGIHTNLQLVRKKMQK